MKQLAGQPSLSLLLPSSQVSPPFSTLLPQSDGMIVLVVVLLEVDVVLPPRLVEVVELVDVLVLVVWDVLVEVLVLVVVAPRSEVEVVDEVDVDVVLELDVVVG